MSFLSLFDKPEETPPGLDAIRTWLSKPRPRLRGLWIWIRWILSGIPAAYRAVKENWPAIRAGIHRVAVESEKVARGAVKVGTAAREFGGGIVTSTRALRGPDGKVSGAVARIREFGKGMREFGGRTTEGGRGVAKALSGLRTLVGNGPDDARPGLDLLDPREESVPEPEPRLIPRRAKPKRSPRMIGDEAPAAATRRTGTTKRSAPPGERPQPAPGASESAPDAADAARKARFEGLPQRFITLAEVGDRPHPESLRALIVEICRHRDWTTPAQLARWFDMHRRSLSNRYLRPLLEAGLLERRFPESPNTPKQAYRTRRPDSSAPAA